MSDAENTIATLRSRGYQITSVGSAMMALAIISVGLRFLAKASGREKSRWGWDDVLITIALAVYITDEALILVAVDRGSQAIDATSPEWSMFSKYVFIFSLLYWTVIAFVTYSILYLYRRIFSTHKVFSICSYAIVGVVTIWWITGSIIDARSYQPTAAFWDSSLTGSYVIDYNMFWIGNMIIELLFEAAVILLPLMEIAKLNLDTRKKAFMVAMFAMGGFVLITGILRIHYAWKSSDMIPGTVWLGVHGSMAIVSACLPTYRPLLSKVPGLLPTTRRGSNTLAYGSHWSRRTGSVDAMGDNATLKNSQSFEENTLYKPQSIADLQLHELETGRKFSVGSPSRAGLGHPVIPEASQSEETLQDGSSLGPPPARTHFG